MGSVFPGGKLFEIIRGGIPSGVGRILGLIPPGMCFPRWETIGNLRRDPNFIWWDPMLGLAGSYLIFLPGK